METWDEFKKEIKISENEISHMYLDTEGYVTVGVGNKLSSVAESQKLSFVSRLTNQLATKDEIKADFESVKRQLKGQIAAKYKTFTKLDLPIDLINNLLDTRIEEFKSQLVLKFPKFNSYPLTVRFALLDMAFNLGTEGLVRKFPSFKKAIEAEDWNKAAKESNRPQVSISRNQTVKKWLEEAGQNNILD
jgi:GH24 family phage-related lysozyme (muramidase)